MNEFIKPFSYGAAVALVLSLAVYGWFGVGRGNADVPFQSAQASLVAEAVQIKVLPPLLRAAGEAVPFEGTVELPLKIAGDYAQELYIVSFAAQGENAHKSALKIVWADGSQEVIPAGARDIRFTPERRAKEISLVGYCMHERRIFKDLPRKGTMSWELRYAPVQRAN